MSTTPFLFTATSQPYCTNAGKKHFCWEAQKEPSPCLADIDPSNLLPLPTGVVSRLASAVSICPLFSRASLHGWLATLWHGASSQEHRADPKPVDHNRRGHGLPLGSGDPCPQPDMGREPSQSIRAHLEEIHPFLLQGEGIFAPLFISWPNFTVHHLHLIFPSP